MNGSICFEKSRNKYRVQIPTPDGKRLTKRFNTEAEAQEFLTNTLSEIYRGQFIEPNLLTFGEYSQQYIETYSANLRPNSVRDLLHSISLMKPLYNIKLQKLSTIQCQSFINKLTCASSTKVKVCQLLRRMIRKAYHLELLPKDFSSAIVSPKLEKTEIEIFTEKEIIAILEFTKNSFMHKRYYELILTALLTGMRLGEILGLKYSDVQNNSIKVQRTVVEINGHIAINPPKTNAGQRTIPITEELQNTLLEYDKCPTDEFIFRTHTNALPIRPSNVERAWRGIIKGSGVAEKNFHTTRHTFATRMLNYLPLLQVSKILGHSQPSHTLNLYGHKIPDFDQTIREKVAEAFQMIPK